MRMIKKLIAINFGTKLFKTNGSIRSVEVILKTGKPTQNTLWSESH